jgi:PilZ domain
VAEAPANTTRRSKRQPARKIIHLSVEAEEDRYGAGGYTLDISPLGSRVHTVLDVRPGEVVEFCPADSEQATRCRVVWKGDPRRGRKDELGLEFLVTFPGHGTS